MSRLSQTAVLFSLFILTVRLRVCRMPIAPLAGSYIFFLAYRFHLNIFIVTHTRIMCVHDDAGRKKNQRNEKEYIVK